MKYKLLGIVINGQTNKKKPQKKEKKNFNLQRRFSRNVIISSQKWKSNIEVEMRSLVSDIGFEWSNYFCIDAYQTGTDQFSINNNNNNNMNLMLSMIIVIIIGIGFVDIHYAVNLDVDCFWMRVITITRVINIHTHSHIYTYIYICEPVFCLHCELWIVCARCFDRAPKQFSLIPIKIKIENKHLQ